MRRPEQELANLLKKNKWTIAFAESMSCGYAAYKLGTISGASDFLAGSIVCYQQSVKISLLNIDKKIIDKHTAESQKVTDLLATNLSTLIKADIYAALTGLAAPGGSESEMKPVGTVFYSVFNKNKIYKASHRIYGSPLEIKKKACAEFFRFIASVIVKS